MAENKLRIGIIGTGFGRYVQVPGFKALDGVEVVGIASRNHENAVRAAAEYDIAESYSHWKDLVDNESIDAVSVTTPPNTHEEIVLEIIKRGKSVLCEKPLTTSAIQAHRILAEAEDKSVVHMVDFEFREIPSWKMAKSIINSGELGEIRHVNINWSVDSWSNPSRPWSWRSDLSSGGGALGALGSHSLDCVEWFVRPVESLCARLTTNISSRPDSSGLHRKVDAEDHCEILMELVGGTPVNALISVVASKSSGHRIEFHGEKKMLLLKQDELGDYGNGFSLWVNEEIGGNLKEVVGFDGHYRKHKFSDGRIMPFLSLAGRFVDCCLGKTAKARPSFFEGYRSRLLMDAAYKSSRERRWIRISEIDLFSGNNLP